MAVSFRVTGSWAELTADGAVTIPSTPQAGDRMFLFARWKDFAITAQVTSPSGWTKLTEFADGSVSSGNGTGSVKVACWYRDWQSGDGSPTVDFSSNPTNASVVIMVMAKSAGEVWLTPLARTAAMTNWTTTSQIVSASATVVVPNSSVVMGLIGIRDDSATMTRPTTGIDDSAGAITWNGNYVESPATHHSTTTGDDGAADLGYRLVTTGATATLRMTGTISAAETGTGLWVVQGSATADPKTATPTTLSLSTSMFAPAVSAPNNKTATPTTLALALATFAPTIHFNKIVTPPTLAISTNRFTPLVSTPRLTTPATLGLTLSTFAPTVTAPNNVTVITSVTSLALSTVGPTVLTPRLVVPGTLGLTLSGFAPTIETPKLVTPEAVSLSLSTFAPSISTPRTVTPDSLGLVITTLTPDVMTPQVTIPITCSLVLTAFAPDVEVTTGNDQEAVPATASLSLAAFAPTILTPRAVTPQTTSLSLSTFAPSAIRPVSVIVANGSLSLTTFPSTVSVAPTAIVVTPVSTALTLTLHAPSVTVSVTLGADFSIAVPAQNLTARTVVQNHRAIVEPEIRTRRDKA